MRNLRNLTQEQIQAIQEKLDAARAAQKVQEETLKDLEAALEPATDDLPNSGTCFDDLDHEDLQGHDVQSLVERLRKKAIEEWEDFQKIPPVIPSA